MLLYVHSNCRLIKDGSPGRSPRVSHSSVSQSVGFCIFIRSSWRNTHSVKLLSFSAFEAFDVSCTTLVGLYRPPHSKQNKGTNKMFLDQFNSRFSPLAHDGKGEITVVGDFNFHFENEHHDDDDDDELMLNVLRCQLTY